MYYKHFGIPTKPQQKQYKWFGLLFGDSIQPTTVKSGTQTHFYYEIFFAGAEYRVEDRVAF